MDSMQSNQTKSADAYQEFVRFSDLHPEVFTFELRKNIYRTAEEIIEIFKADNAVENVHLKALKNLWNLQPSTIR
jgi:hypothetical protein